MAFKGSITGTGATDAFNGKNIMFSLDFTGTATVSLQVDLMGDGTWLDDTEFTADAIKVIEGPSAIYRFNCSAYTDQVNYVVAGAN